MTSLSPCRWPLLAFFRLCLVLLLCLQPSYPLSFEQYNVGVVHVGLRQKSSTLLASKRNVANALREQNSTRSAFTSLPNGKVLLLENSCQEVLRHGQIPSCDINLEVTDPLNRSEANSYKLLSASEYPGLYGTGVWASEKQGAIEKILVLFLSAVCPEKQPVCRCSKETGCLIHFEEKDKTACSGTAYNERLAPQGARICQGTRIASDPDAGNFPYYYSLNAAEGWQCRLFNANSEENSRKKEISGLAGRAGFRLGTPGIRYGSLFLAEFDGELNRQWVKLIAENVPLLKEQHQRMAITGGKVLGQLKHLEMQYAVTFTREKCESKTGKSDVLPYCETVLINAHGDLAKTKLPGSRCESCLSSLASLHPETGAWGLVCVRSKAPKPGILINGRLAIDSKARRKTESQNLSLVDEAVFYSKDTQARLLPAKKGKWVLIWREGSWDLANINGLTAPSATLKAAVLQENELHAGIVTQVVSLLGPYLEGSLVETNAVSLTPETAVVTAVDLLQKRLVAATLDLSKLRIRGQLASVAIEDPRWNVSDGFLGHSVLRLSGAKALWLGSLGTKQDSLAQASPTRSVSDSWEPVKAMILRVDEEEELCQGESVNII